ncbi:MAG TPA: hypothetical protein VNZ05_09430 [Solirubrobacteraceae bacterium]|nr:hypothetical protein [Solirubrobacteraceae bacterium]
MSIDTHDQLHARTRRRSGRLAAAALAIAAAATLAACGGSGSSSANSASNSANTTTQGGGQRSGRFAALRACLQKEGVNLPSRPSGKPRQPGGGGLHGPGGGGFKAPAGVSQSKFQEALKKCGGSFPGGGRRFSGAAGQAALRKFAQCMRENGVNLPAPNTSGNGPVFNTKGINTASSPFKAAQSKCAGDLRGAFGAGGGRPGGAPPSGGGGAPPGEGGGGPPGEAGGGPPGGEPGA